MLALQAIACQLPPRSTEGRCSRWRPGGLGYSGLGVDGSLRDAVPSDGGSRINLPRYFPACLRPSPRPQGSRRGPSIPSHKYIPPLARVMPLAIAPLGLRHARLFVQFRFLSTLSNAGSRGNFIRGVAQLLTQPQERVQVTQEFTAQARIYKAPDTVSLFVGGLSFEGGDLGAVGVGGRRRRR
jgi:hypothetical protein